jgi:hypothetical protein
MRRFAVISIFSFLLALLISVTSFSARANCNDELQASEYPRLRRNSLAVTLPEEKFSYGKIASSPDELAKLPPGLYNYIITRDLKLTYALAVPAPYDPAHLIVTHRTLAQYYFDEMKASFAAAGHPLESAEDVDVIAAGDALIPVYTKETLADPEARLAVQEDSNQSNTYQGKTPQLYLFEKVAKSYAANIVTATKRWDWSTKNVNESHAKQLLEAQMMVKLTTDPRFKGMIDDFENARREIFKRYTDPVTPGKLNWVEFYSDPTIPSNEQERVYQNLKAQLGYDDLLSVTGSLSKTENPHEKYFFLAGVIEKLGETKAKLLFSSLQSLQGFFLRD